MDDPARNGMKCHHTPNELTDFEKSMLKSIKSFVELFVVVQEQEQPRLSLAAAALFVEMASQDEHIDTAEKDTIKALLEKQFGVNGEDADQLFDLARKALHEATDYYQFTRLIAQNFSQPEKVQLIESLWEIALADQVLHKYEEHMIRRICDLIHVSHKDMMQTKLRVLEAL